MQESVATMSDGGLPRRLMTAIDKKQVWKNKNSGNTITVLKFLGKDKWWVSSSSDAVHDFKIRTNMIRDNYELVSDAK